MIAKQQSVVVVFLLGLILLFGIIPNASAQGTLGTFGLSVSTSGASADEGNLIIDDYSDSQNATFTITGVPNNVQIPITFTFNISSNITASTGPFGIALGEAQYTVLGGGQYVNASAQIVSVFGQSYPSGSIKNGPFQITCMASQSVNMLISVDVGVKSSAQEASASASASLGITNVSVPWSILAKYPNLRIRQQVVLPDISTDEGLIAVLVLGENLAPGRPGYNAADTFTAMQAMKACIDNRLNNNPAQFGAPGAQNYADILWADNPIQFPEFQTDDQGNRYIDPAFLANVNNIVMLANNGNQSDLTFVEMALQVARQPVNDPFADITQIGLINVLGGTYFWRPLTSPNPGTPRAIPIPASMGGVLSGTQFFGLLDN